MTTIRNILKKKNINLKIALVIAIVCFISFIVMLILIGFFNKRYTFAFFRTDSLTNTTLVLLEKDIEKHSSLKGKIVSFNFPLDTQYFKKDTPFAKEVKCESGDILATQGREYFCNSNSIGKARITDSKGIPVKQFTFNGVIPKDFYFVMGDNPKSFDSRYWGLLSKDNIKGVAIWKY